MGTHDSIAGNENNANIEASYAEDANSPDYQEEAKHMRERRNQLAEQDEPVMGILYEPYVAPLEESIYDDEKRLATLSSGQQIFGFHKSTHCNNATCPVHNPTDHRYRDYPLMFNFNVFIFEREITDEKGRTQTVPDPDDAKVKESVGGILYRNSIRCLQCGHDVTSVYRHDMKTCPCGAVSVDGGSAYQRILGNREDWKDTSLLYVNGEWLDRSLL